jgi:hypothetical protein
MPRVVPYYAVKCNPEPGILKLLVAMGTGFDCASKGELEMMLKLGVPPSRIIFAHPCKRASDIRYAREHNIGLTTVSLLGLHVTEQGSTAWPCTGCHRRGCCHAVLRASKATRVARRTAAPCLLRECTSNAFTAMCAVSHSSLFAAP